MDERQIRARLAEGRHRIGVLDDRAAWLDALARDFDEDADEASALLLDVLDAWGPEVLQGRTAETGHAMLLEQRDRARVAANEVAGLADEARRRAAAARAEITGLQAEAARLQVTLGGMDSPG